ncbi:hypothetical protein ACO0LG_04640 [Undibacterium sp. Ji42W]|uniref:hypothetical protein n=1 Tax=Undibacterium sp. Ji42W TaxID=3413039 RepID=UPI003BF1BA38
MNEIKPSSIAGATIIMQVFLLIIIFLGISGYREDRHSQEGSIKAPAFGLGLVLAILTIFIIGISEEFYKVWGALMGDLSVPTINQSLAMMFVFLLDITITIFLIVLTGGTRSSPFTSVLFLIPSLAIFLRESPSKFLSYTAIIGVFYWLTCRANYRDPTRLSYGIDDELAPYRTVNIGCLILGTVIGYITRPGT